MPSIGNIQLGRSYKRIINKKLQVSKLLFTTHTKIIQPSSVKCLVSQQLEEIQSSRTITAADINPLTNDDQKETWRGSNYSNSFIDNGVQNNSEVRQTAQNPNFFIKPDETSINHSLRSWAIQNNIKSRAVNSLLYILKQHSCFSELPKDSRSLLKTPRKINIIKVKPGNYCHFPLVKTLSKVVENDNFPSIGLQLNVDGVPISKSSSQQFWPILAHVVNKPSSPPFVLGIYYGTDKPESSNKFLEIAVQELLEISETGIVTGYFACTKCQIEGEHYKHRMTFDGLSIPLRTDESFRLQTNEDHHLEDESELLRLPIDIIQQIPLDYQHLICLGVVRKLLNLWIRGKLNKFRLSARQTHILSQKIIELKPYFSKDFQRKPRSLLHLKNWKATEYRTFLLYVGPIVLNSILPSEYYNHFLCLHVAVTVLCCRKLHAPYLGYAKKLLNYFVENFATLYGLENISYNVHCLIHITDDSSNFGLLDEFSTFRFENYLGKLKKLIRSGNRPLEQIHNRIVEDNLLNEVNITSCPYSTDTRVPEFKTAHFTLSLSLGDNGCILDCGTPFLITDIQQSHNEKVLCGKTLQFSSSLYTIPCDSTLLAIGKYQLSRDQCVISAARDIAVIHRNWIQNNMCYWPPFWKTARVLVAAIKEGMLPDPQTWSPHLGHVVRNKFYDTYELARKDLEPAQQGSDFSANEVVGRRRRATEMTQSMAHSESDESPPISKPTTCRNPPNSKKRKLFPAATAIHKLPTPPTPTLTSVDEMTHSIILPGSSVKPSGEISSGIPDFGPPRTYANCSPAGQTIPGVPIQPGAYFPHSPVITDSSYNHKSSTIYKTQTMAAPFTSGQQSNPVFGENVCEDSGQRDEAFRFNSHGFPYSNAEPNMDFGFQPGFATQFRSNEPIYIDPAAIRSLQRGQQILTAKEFLKTESDIRKDKRFKQDLICILSAKGGNNPNQITYRIVAALMTDYLMRSFTFAGQTGKRSFKDTLFVDCICEAVRRCPKGSTASDKDIEKAIDYWLKKSATRINRSTKRQNADGRQQSTSERLQRKDGSDEDELELIPETP
ncbi:hypothetical protein Ocin01_14323 [Orchesella cincta]|uniref:DUF4806 domain-containing protein n=1 Tax=Orchesella cincta TaxID=48709 RepID=A0A1D2MHD8_ORCCI|nr:hypothetical protein Ocin01_14323 [Orchesella cincta]